MKNTINFFKTLYYKNRLLFAVAIFVVVIFLAGCSAQGSPPPSGPSGPIGGGC